MASKSTTLESGEIAKRAYSYFAARGFAHGHDREDWNRAEADVRREQGNPATVTAPRSGSAAKAVRSTNRAK